jgi:hypothetical protein
MIRPNPLAVTLLLLLLGAHLSFSQSEAAAPQRAPASATQLSPQQQAEASKIIFGAKQRGKSIADRLAANARDFDDVLLGERADVAADGKAADAIKEAICDTSDNRLQAARRVVHLLTADQRRYLRAEMAKPGSEKGILEAVTKVFQVKVEGE